MTRPKRRPLARPSAAPYAAAASIATVSTPSEGVGASQLEKAQLAAERVLASVARGISSITGVMGTPPTITSAATVSTLSGAANTNGAGMYQLEDSTVFTPIGCKINLTANGRTYQNMTGNVSTGVKRSGSSGFMTTTDAPAIDFCVNNAGATVSIYITDMLTGVRARVAINDTLCSALNNRYTLLDFAGVSRPRKYEIYGNSSGLTPNSVTFRGFNCTTGYTMQAPVFDPVDLRVLIVGDSHVNRMTGGGTNVIKLCYMDYLCAKLGVGAFWLEGNGGTGFLNPSSPLGTYVQRQSWGDTAMGWTGPMDVVYLAGTTNDGEALNAAYTDAAVQEAVRVMVLAALSDQPNALVIVPGPFSRTVSPTATPQVMLQSRYDAIEAGVIAAGNPRAVYIDNSPDALAEDIPLADAGTYIGADGTHLTDAGGVFIGNKRGNEIIAAVTALAA